jgi:uncharacterized protein YxeA
MKKIIFLMSFCASSILLFAQQRYQDVPEEVRRSYQRDYPDYYNNSTWDMNNNQWHTRYMDRNQRRYVDIYYDRNGRRVRSQTEWNRTQLPSRVRDRLRSRYRNDGWYRNNNYQVYRIERPGRGIFFQLSIGGNKVIYLDERGREVRYY